MLPVERTLQLVLVHLRPAREVRPLRPLVQLGPGGIAFRTRAPGLAPALARFRPLQRAPVLRRGLLVRSARLMQRNRDGLARVAHLASAAALQLAMLELVHDPAD